MADLLAGRDLLDDTEVNPVAGTVRAGLQGMTFGLSDEIGGALAALAGSIQTGESFGDAYDKIHQQLQDKRETFAQENPGTALGAEVVGALATGGAGGSRLLAGKGFQGASNIGKAGRISAVGAGEGAVYGAGAADQGERGAGAAQGAVLGGALAAVGAGVLNAAGRGLGAGTNYVTARQGAYPP